MGRERLRPVLFVPGPAVHREQTILGRRAPLEAYPRTSVGHCAQVQAGVRDGVVSTCVRSGADGGTTTTRAGPTTPRGGCGGVIAHRSHPGDPAGRNRPGDPSAAATTDDATAPRFTRHLDEAHAGELRIDGASHPPAAALRPPAGNRPDPDGTGWIEMLLRRVAKRRRRYRSASDRFRPSRRLVKLRIRSLGFCVSWREYG